MLTYRKSEDVIGSSFMKVTMAQRARPGRTAEFLTTSLRGLDLREYEMCLANAGVRFSECDLL